jgi:ribosomal protein S18 acetylase RimI-like enzyme
MDTLSSLDQGWTHESHLIRENRISKEEAKDVLHDSVNPLLLALDKDTHQLIGTLQVEAAEHYEDLEEYKGEGYEPPTLAESSLKTQQVFLRLISVDPKQQSRGIGRKLVDAGLQYARETMGRKQAVVYVIYQRQELCDWYKRIGFVDYGEKIAYPDPQKLKQDDVHFSVLKLTL